MIRTALAVSALLLATATPATAAPTGYIIWDSDAGAHPTQGRSGNWTPPELFSVRNEEENRIRVQGEDSTGWEYLVIELGRHDGLRITEGSYVDQRALVVNRGLGWWDEAAEFTVDHIAYDADGRISELEAAVEHHYRDQPDTEFRAKVSYRR
ncbi:hypothetical protein [Lentzea sp. CC55]|uniref:hypothetical protein n=1 Tax=Lentzea sp. CC55 TaxID=2884909 RepID=UPI001F45A977|nr:hypothetical protein [Lentzea sp. CC55]MCG8922419.1 hypothetical protein [Lentzea sp. CC55]